VIVPPWFSALLFSGGTFARTGTATFVDADGIVQTAETGVRRAEHYIAGTRTLLLEGQRTNLCIRSEEFDTWANVTTTVTANAITAPDGTTTADLLTSAATDSRRERNLVAFTGDGEKSIAVYAKAGTAATASVRLVDNTAAVIRHRVTITWTAGVPTLSTLQGAGTLYPVEALANGWYRILFSVTGVVAANTNTISVYGDTTVGTAGTYFWGAQAENAVVPSSYIKTEGTTITRNADSLFFPFERRPQAMTVYVRTVNIGAFTNSGTSTNFWQIGGQNPTTGVRFTGRVEAVTPQTIVQYSDGVNPNANAQVAASPSPVRGDLIEMRGVLKANWGTTNGVSVNNAAEVTANSPVTNFSTAAFAQERLWLSGPLIATNNPVAYTHVTAVPGEKSMAEMRVIAGVS
jgi:hypothetical protein